MSIPASWWRSPSVRRTAVLILASLALLLPGACGDRGTQSGGAARPAMPVVVATAIQETVPIYNEYVATVDASESVDIRARVEAYLQKQHFQEGRLVRAGDLLFSLDPRQYAADLQSAQATLAKAKADLVFATDKVTVLQAQATLDQAQARLAKANQDVSRLKPLAEQQAVPQQDYDDAMANRQVAEADVTAKQASYDTTVLNQKVSIDEAHAAVLSAEAQIQRAELNLSYCSVQSPITGLIGRRQVAPGNLVGRGEATLLATVSALDPLRVTFAVSETDWLYLMRRVQREVKESERQLIELVLADGSTHTHKGRFIIAERQVDPKTGTLAMVCEFHNPEYVLRPGMFGRVRLAVDRRENAILIPQRAVMELQSAQTVYVVGPENKVALRTVVLGGRSGNRFIVADGLRAGERVIVEGQLKVKPGMPVAPTDKPMTEEQGAH